MKLSDPIDKYALSTRTRNCLHNFCLGGYWDAAEIRTIEDLVSHTGAELLTQPNFGKRSLREVESLLGMHGLCLKGGGSSPRENARPWFEFCL